MEISRVQPADSPNRDLILEDLLVSLCELAVEEGASDCAVIECSDLEFKEVSPYAADVPQEERSLFWPVPLFPSDSLQDALKLYSRAVVFRLNSSGYSPDAVQEQVFKIAGLLESACFYGGSHLSIGLAAGNCKDVFCKDEPRCQALKMGKPCLYPLKSRPSIEACGLDPQIIATKAGWSDSDSEASIIGMVFVS
jgi:predicted metal-binding protein